MHAEVGTGDGAALLRAVNAKMGIVLQWGLETVTVTMSLWCG
jgi:hypothetical protein